MAEAVLDQLGPVLTRWTMGGSAASAAPTAWREALGEGGEAELRLLALSGQFLGTLALSEPSGEVRARPELPALAHPPLADALRPRARRVLAQLRDAVARRNLLDFLDARGWTLHPGDWLPGVNEDVPETYAPWQDWASSDRDASAPAPLTAESWDQLGTAARNAAFAALRRHDPAQAAALLAEKIGGENADARVRLLEAMTARLSDADRPLLEDLAGDRAPRVQALVGSLLARLGHGADTAEDVAELADFFPLRTKGLLRRTRQVDPQPIKTPAQRSRRGALLESVTFGAFAGALALTPEELVAAWPWGSDHLADHLFTGMAARSAPDPVVVAITEVLTSGSDSFTLAPLLPRLTPADRRHAAARALRAKGATFALALDLVGGDGGIDEAMRMPAGAALLAALKAEDGRPADQSAELLALGLIASRAAAQQALDQLTAAGVIASDPRLDMLRLNAALEDRGASR